MEKIRVLLFGRSGAGKSTIANALIEEDLCTTGDGVRGVTMECKPYSTAKSKYEVFDTMGLGETNEIGAIPHEKAIHMIENYLNQLDIKLHHVCFVVPAERFDGLNKIYWITFNRIFRKCANNMLIIVTKCNEGWIEQNESDIKSIMGNIPIVGVDFPKKSNKSVIENDNIEERVKSISRLENFLETIRNSPGFTTCNPNPDPSIAEDILRILSDVKKGVRPAATWINRMMIAIKNFLSKIENP